MSIEEKDVYEELWRGRDFELTHFWQRAIFLSGFLFGCYVTYWDLVLKMFGSGTSFARCNALAILVSIVGVGVSILWILMAKGSKAWYEDWENGIYQFVDTLIDKAKEERVGEEPKQKEQEKNYLKWAGFHFRDQITIPDRKQPDHNLLTTRGGRFSPSRINIAIGQLSALLFGVAFAVHVFIFSKGYKTANEVAQVVKQIPLEVILLTSLLAAILFFLYIRHNLVSKDL